MEEKLDFQIEGVYNLMNDVIVSGTVKSGVLRVGMKANIEGQSGVIQAIESFRKMIREATPETKVGLKLSGVKKAAIENRMNAIITFSGPALLSSETSLNEDPMKQSGNKLIVVALAIGIAVATAAALLDYHSWLLICFSARLVTAV